MSSVLLNYVLFVRLVILKDVWSELSGNGFVSCQSEVREVVLNSEMVWPWH